MSRSQWQVVTCVLEILYKLLRDHEVTEADFREEVLELPNGSTVAASKTPGFSLLMHMLNDSPLFKMVSHCVCVCVLDCSLFPVGVYTLTISTPFKKKKKKKLNFIHLLSLLGNLCCLTLVRIQQPQEQRYSALPYSRWSVCVLNFFPCWC